MSEEINKDYLIDWIDRPPSNIDLNVIDYILSLKQKVEQLENIRKEAIEYIKSYKNDYAPYELSDYNIREILNILNKGDNNDR